MGKGKFIRDGRYIRRLGSGKVYAIMTAKKLKIEDFTKLFGLLNGETLDPKLHFVLVSPRTVICRNIDTDETIQGLGFQGDNATRITALLERLGAVTAPNFIDEILASSGMEQPQQ